MPKRYVVVHRKDPTEQAGSHTWILTWEEPSALADSWSNRCLYLLTAEWSNMVLQQLDLSHNSLRGPLPASWTQQSAGTLALTLQTLLLNSNQMNGPWPTMVGMLALSCWSVEGNWFLCGPVPDAGTCGSLNGTRLGKGHQCVLSTSIKTVSTMCACGRLPGSVMWPAQMPMLPCMWRVLFSPAVFAGGRRSSGTECGVCCVVHRS